MPDQTGGNPLTRFADRAKVLVTKVAAFGASAVRTPGSVASGVADAVLDSGNEDTHKIRGCQSLHSATEWDDEDELEPKSEQE